MKIGVKWGFIVCVKLISKIPSSVKRRGKRRKKKKKVFGNFGSSATGPIVDILLLLIFRSMNESFYFVRVTFSSPMRTKVGGYEITLEEKPN